MLFIFVRAGAIQVDGIIAEIKPIGINRNRESSNETNNRLMMDGPRFDRRQIATHEFQKVGTSRVGKETKESDTIKKALPKINAGTIVSTQHQLDSIDKCSARAGPCPTSICSMEGGTSHHDHRPDLTYMVSDKS